MSCLLAQATRHLAALRIPALQLLHREFLSYRNSKLGGAGPFSATHQISVAGPEDPYVFGPPGSGSGSTS